MAIQVAETAKAKRVRKVLSHIEIHPQLGGGHVVRHVYSGYSAEPKEYSFNAQGKAQGGEHIAAHLTKHAGLPEMEAQPELMDGEEA